MGLTNALSSALSGLRFTQTSLQLTASNIANAETPGYTRKSLSPTANYVDGMAMGVSAGQIQRQLDLTTQVQFRRQSATGQYTSITAGVLSQLDALFGSPGGATSLDTLYSGLTGAVSALAASPESSSARYGVLNAATSLAGQLNSLTDQVQSLREQAESGLRDATAKANDALQTIQRIGEAIQTKSGGGPPPSDLLDQRDQAIDTLSQLMDITVTEMGGGQIAISTANGTPLFDGRAARLDFDARPGVSPEDQWTSDPTTRTVGTLSVVTGGGNRIDLFADGSIRGGVIGAYRDLRDTILPEAQQQLDAVADQMARAVSTVDVAGTPAPAGPANGFDVDLSGLLSGNTVTLDYRDLIAGANHRVTFVRVNDPASLPLPDTLSADPTDHVVGIDFSGGMASVVAQMQAALGAGFAVSNPGGNTIRILDDGVAGTTDVNGLAATRTATGLTNGDVALPLFTDAAGQPYSAAVDGRLQSIGFAGRISVNPAVSANPSVLVQYSSSTASGDPARPSRLLDRLGDARFTFGTGTGIGTASDPFTGSIGDFVGEVLGYRGEVAQTATARDTAQQTTVNSLHERLSQSAAVNIDDEMAHLVELQNAYAANARMMSAIKDLFDLLMKI